MRIRQKNKIIRSFLGVLTLLSFFTLYGCKKDKLDSGKEILEGKWKWMSTEYIDYDWWAGNDTSNFTPASLNNNYYLEFEKKGILRLINDNNSKRKRIVFAKFANSEQFLGYHYFGIFLNNDHHFLFQGIVSQDTLVLYHSPHVDYEVSDTTYSTSYFIRN